MSLRWWTSPDARATVATAFVSSSSKTVEASPTRTTGPPPIGDSGKLRDVSMESTLAPSGTVPSLAAAIAPMNPSSSARVRRTPK